jgi:hypothetical protein
MQWQQTPPDKLAFHEMLILHSRFPNYFKFRAIGQLNHVDFQKNRTPKIVGNITVYSAINDETPYVIGFNYNFKSNQAAQRWTQFLTQNAFSFWKIESDYFVFGSGNQDQYFIELPDPQLTVIEMPEPYSLENLCINV